MTNSQISTEASPAQKSAIDALQKFYGLIVAIAFTGGVKKFIDSFQMSGWDANQISETLLFMAFVATIVPFYHGMERHLFETHVARNDINWGKNGRPSNILLDIFTFMIEGALLFSIGQNIDAPKTFLWLWSLLLVVDIIWSLIVWNYQKGTRPIWARNNLIWLIVAWIAWSLTPPVFSFLSWNDPWVPVVQTLVVAVSETLRSVFDYKAHWHFYFPDDLYQVDKSTTGSNQNTSLR